MSTMSELVQANFKLTAEVRRLRDELATLKAVQHMEDSDEVARIKAAYSELEAEVVSLRRGQLRSVPSTPTYEQPLTDSDSLSVIALLSDQLEAERNRYTELEGRYQELRKDVSEESSTCVGSPPYPELSVEQLTSVVIGDDVVFFNPPPKTRRLVVGLSEPARQTVASVPTVVKRPPSKSIERLSKIARFKPRH